MKLPCVSVVSLEAFELFEFWIHEAWEHFTVSVDVDVESFALFQ